MNYFLPLCLLILFVGFLAFVRALFGVTLPSTPALVLLCIGVIAAYAHSEGISSRDSLLRKSGILMLYLVGGLFAGIAYRLLALLLAYPENSWTAGSSSLEFTVWFVLATVLIEEVLLRGYLFRLLERVGASAVVQCALQGVLFALVHGGDRGEYRLFFYAAFGCLLTAFRVTSQSIFPSIGFHLGWNLWALLLSPLAPAIALIGLSKANSDTRYGLFGCLLVALSAVLLWHRQRRCPRSC
jgi:membrane protease YdiL (CAAX protease family)